LFVRALRRLDLTPRRFHSCAVSDDATKTTGAAQVTTATIFDLDGTLADTMPIHFRAWTEVAERFHLAFPESRFYAMGGVPTIKIAATLLAEQNLALDPAMLTEAKETAVLRHFSEVRAIEPVVEIARRCRELGPVAIASGGGRSMVERTLRQIGLGDFFSVVVAAEDTTRHKPEPDVFLEAARRMGAEPAVCTVYEDTDVGLEAARRAGMRSVDVRPLYLPRRPAA
jgi:beta-phosphoglucomutase-like phosphatase (HAD superfamily)